MAVCVEEGIGEEVAPMAVTVALSSIKGGVGKTSAAVNLAALAAADGVRTLLWDIDPQGAATYSLGVGARVPGGARRLARKRPGAAAAVTPTAWHNLDVIPADFSLRHLDLELSDLGKPRRRLEQALRPITDRYEAVFIDCPPGITLAIESALRATDVVLVPIVPSVLPLRSYDQLAAYVAADSKLRKAQVLGFLSMVDRRKKGHRDLWEHLPAERDGVLRAAIPASVQVENMPVHRMPLVAQDGHSPPVIAYRELWKELRARFPGST
jgi:cellulose biosynthesis protein BcsQ